MKCETVWLIACSSSDEDGVDTSAGGAEDGVGRERDGGMCHPIISNGHRCVVLLYV